MIDLKVLRDNPEFVRASYDRRGGVEGLDRILELDARHRELLGEVERLRADHNRANKAIGKTSPDERASAIADAKAIGEKADALTPELSALGPSSTRAQLISRIFHMRACPTV